MQRSLNLSLVSAAFLVWTSLVFAQDVPIRRVVTTGSSGAGENTAPGISVSPTIDATFTAFGVAPINFGRSPQIDDGGNVTFSSHLNGVSVTGVNSSNDTSSWFYDGNSLSLVVREGSTAPGTTTSFADDAGFTRVMSNSSGDLVFARALQDGTWGVFSDQGLGLSLVAKEGELAPGTAANFSNLRVGMQINEPGTVLVHGASTSGIGLWVQDTGGTLQKIQAHGDLAPGLSGATFNNSSQSRQVGFNNAGTVAFVSGLAGVGVTASNDSSVWVYDNAAQSLSLLLREGDTIGSSTLNQISESTVNLTQLNDQDQLAFLGSIHQSGQNRQAVLSNRSGNWETLYQGGDAIASAGGAQLGQMSSLSQNQLGQVQFQSTLTGVGVHAANDLAIFTERMDGLTMIVREGDIAAGTSGAVFGQISSTATFTDVVFNSQGQSAFVGTLSSGVGDAVFNNNDQGIWATDPFGTLQLVARRGMTNLPFTNDLNASNNVPWPFRSLVINGLNDQGQLLFTAFSTGNAAAVFIADLGSANVAANQSVILDQTGDIQVPGDVNVEGELEIKANVKVATKQTFTKVGGKVVIDGELESELVTSAGELKVNGKVTGDVIIEDGGTLSGNALIEGNLLIAEGGTIAPGNSPGVVQNLGDVTFAGGGIFEFQLLDVSLDPLLSESTPGWTLLEIDGDLVLDIDSNHPFLVSVQGLSAIGPDVLGPPILFDGSQEYEFTFITWTGLAWGELADDLFQVNVSNPADFGPGSFSIALGAGGQSLKLVYAVPEIPSWTLLLAGAIAAGYSHRRRVRRCP